MFDITFRISRRAEDIGGISIKFHAAKMLFTLTGMYVFHGPSFDGRPYDG